MNWGRFHFAQGSTPMPSGTDAGRLPLTPPQDFVMSAAAPERSRDSSPSAAHPASITTRPFMSAITVESLCASTSKLSADQRVVAGGDSPGARAVVDRPLKQGTFAIPVVVVCMLPARSPVPAARCEAHWRGRPGPRPHSPPTLLPQRHRLGGARVAGRPSGHLTIRPIFTAAGCYIRSHRHHSRILDRTAQTSAIVSWRRMRYPPM